MELQKVSICEPRFNEEELKSEKANVKSELTGIVSKKTDDAPTIFLNEYSKSIYMKYKDRDTDKGLLFPRKSNQKMNKSLKKIACKLGITREVSKTEYCGTDRSDITTRICDILATHAGRRTFVVHCAEEGWTEEMIRTYTGHEDFKAMRPYFAIGDKKRRMFMECVVLKKCYRI